MCFLSNALRGQPPLPLLSAEEGGKEGSLNLQRGDGEQERKGSRHYREECNRRK